MSVRVLFVCLGNICRSPTAHGVFRERIRREGLAASITVDSCGTAGFHVGESPDPRAVSAARSRGYDLTDLRARQLSARDFAEFDYVLTMDRQNQAFAAQVADSVGDARAQPRLFLDFASQHHQSEVPDPYYGGDNGFDEVLDLIEDASEGLLKEIREHHL